MRNTLTGVMFFCVVEIFRRGVVGLAWLMVWDEWAGPQRDEVDFWVSLVVQPGTCASAGKILAQHGHQGHGILDSKGDMAKAWHAHS